MAESTAPEGAQSPHGAQAKRNRRRTPAAAKATPGSAPAAKAAPAATNAPAAKKTAAKKTGTKKSAGKRQQLAGELATALKVVREHLDQCVEHYSVRVGGWLAEVVTALESDRAGADPPPLPPAKELAAMLDDVGALRTKPERGRPRDLAAIHRLAKALAKRVRGA